MSTLERPYGNRKRPGHHAERIGKGHPRRQARRERAEARAAKGHSVEARTAEQGRELREATRLGKWS